MICGRKYGKADKFHVPIGAFFTGGERDSMAVLASIAGGVSRSTSTEAGWSLISKRSLTVSGRTHLRQGMLRDKVPSREVSPDV